MIQSPRSSQVKIHYYPLLLTADTQSVQSVCHKKHNYERLEQITDRGHINDSSAPLADQTPH